MAINDALLMIDLDWSNIEPRLTVRELAALADLWHHPQVDDVGPTETAFTLLAPTLPTDHLAWSALRSSGTRFSPGNPRTSSEEVLSRLIAHAQTTLTRPSIVEDAAADFLVEATQRTVLRAGILAEEPFARDPLVAVDIGGRRVFPLFQFASVDPVTVHELVWQLNEQLGGFEDPLGAVNWWLTPNTWLGQPPAALLGTGREAEIEYAAAQLTNDNW